MTAWYTLLLALVLLTLGIALSTLFERRLRDEVDDRLLRTAVEVRRGFPPEDPLRGRVRIPALDPFVSPGLLIEVVDANGVVQDRSANLGQATLPIVGEPTLDPSPRFATSPAGASTVRVVDLPLVTTDGRYIGSVVVGESVLSIDRAVSDLRRLLVVASAPGLALAALGGWLLAGRAFRPVDAITAAASRIAAGDGVASSLSTRLAVPRTGDELSRLAATFNTMLDRLEAAFTAQRRFVADASHELRTPLTAIRGNVDVLSRQLTALRAGRPEIDEALDDIAREGARMGRLLEDLLLLARADAPASDAPPLRTRPVNLGQLVRDAVRTAGPLVHGQRLEAIAPDQIEVVGDEDRLLQLLLILIENALRHTPAGGDVTVSVGMDDGGRAKLVVRDTGEGILPRHLPHIFDRFYRVDGVRARASGGTGLGLAIAQTITRLHGGEITVCSEPGEGSTFVVTLPTVTPTRPPANGDREQGPPLALGETVEITSGR